ncbi:MAG: DUF378 domain-containing protein [Planctomycetota bacterium]|jgi:uncharacterized membrane protein YuzA (DUF378 family)
MKTLDVVTGLLLIVAGIHVGLTAVNLNIVKMVPGPDMAHKALFVLMGAAAVYQFVMWRAIRKRVKN